MLYIEKVINEGIRDISGEVLRDFEVDSIACGMGFKFLHSKTKNADGHRTIINLDCNDILTASVIEIEKRIDEYINDIEAEPGQLYEYGKQLKNKLQNGIKTELLKVCGFVA